MRYEKVYRQTPGGPAMMADITDQFPDDIEQFVRQDIQRYAAEHGQDGDIYTVIAVEEEPPLPTRITLWTWTASKTVELTP